MIELAERHGVYIPDDVMIMFVDPGKLHNGVGALAEYQQIANYMAGNTMMAQFQSVASKYNIQSIQAFELYDDNEGDFGLMKSDGQTTKAAYWAYKNFVAGHPM